MKKTKFKGNNAKIVGDTRLTKREMKKMQAAYHNVERDFTAKLEREKNNPAHTNEDIVPADLGHELA
jgi:hypothetical protein